MIGFTNLCSCRTAEDLVSRRRDSTTSQIMQPDNQTSFTSSKFTPHTSPERFPIDFTADEAAKQIAQLCVDRLQRGAWPGAAPWNSHKIYTDDEQKFRPCTADDARRAEDCLFDVAREFFSKWNPGVKTPLPLSDLCILTEQAVTSLFAEFFGNMSRQKIILCGFRKPASMENGY